LVTKLLTNWEDLDPNIHLFGPEPACSFSIEVAKKAVRDWTNRDHKNTGNP
jgi:hypothetical protein